MEDNINKPGMTPPDKNGAYFTRTAVPPQPQPAPHAFTAPASFADRLAPPEGGPMALTPLPHEEKKGLGRLKTDKTARTILIVTGVFTLIFFLLGIILYFTVENPPEPKVYTSWESYQELIGRQYDSIDPYATERLFLATSSQRDPDCNEGLVFLPESDGTYVFTTRTENADYRLQLYSYDKGSDSFTLLRSTSGSASGLRYYCYANTCYVISCYYPYADGNTLETISVTRAYY